MTILRARAVVNRAQLAAKSEGEQVSLFSSIGKAVKSVVKTVAPIAATGVFGPVGAAIGTVLTARQAVTRATPAPAMGFAGLPAVVSRGVPAVARSTALRAIPGAGRALAPVASGSLIKRAFTPGTSPLELPNFGSSGRPRKKYRRINPCNGKAAKRAARRLKASMKLLREIESFLPKRRACAPAAPFAPRRRRKC